MPVRIVAEPDVTVDVIVPSRDLIVVGPDVTVEVTVEVLTPSLACKGPLDPILDATGAFNPIRALTSACGVTATDDAGHMLPKGLEAEVDMAMNFFGEGFVTVSLVTVAVLVRKVETNGCGSYPGGGLDRSGMVVKSMGVSGTEKVSIEMT